METIAIGVNNYKDMESIFQFHRIFFQEENTCIIECSVPEEDDLIIPNGISMIRQGGQNDRKIFSIKIKLGKKDQKHKIVIENSQKTEIIFGISYINVGVMYFFFPQFYPQYISMLYYAPYV